jgi:hypothetical protein
MRTCTQLTQEQRYQMSATKKQEVVKKKWLKQLGCIKARSAVRCAEIFEHLSVALVT